MHTKFTASDKKFLIENYPKFGSRHCSEQLGRSISSINCFCSRNKIKCDVKYMDPLKRKINPEKFTETIDATVSYFLGFLWGDGSIRSNNKHYTVNLNINYDDGKELLNKIKDIGDIRMCKINRKNTPKTWKQECSIYFSNKPIWEFLKENDYELKSKVSPTKILSKIPHKYHNLFWRGFLDADGCIYTNLTKKHYAISFTGSFNQDWEELIKMLKSIGVKKISSASKQNKKSSYSKILVQRKSDISMLGNYLYNNYEGLWLERKRNKFIEFSKCIS